MNKQHLPYVTAIFIALLLFSTGVIASDNTGNNNNGFGVSDAYRNVSASEFRDILGHNPNVFLLDVRTHAEYNYVHIEGATLIPLRNVPHHDPNPLPDSQLLPNRMNELPKNKNTIITVYCYSGKRGAEASQLIVNAGYTKVFNLDKGLPTWVNAGYPVVMNPTKLADNYPYYP